jgi:hypothetical protein
MTGLQSQDIAQLLTLRSGASDGPSHRDAPSRIDIGPSNDVSGNPLVRNTFLSDRSLCQTGYSSQASACKHILWQFVPNENRYSTGLPFGPLDLMWLAVRSPLECHGKPDISIIVVPI